MQSNALFSNKQQFEKICKTIETGPNFYNFSHEELCERIFSYYWDNIETILDSSESFVPLKPILVIKNHTNSACRGPCEKVYEVYIYQPPLFNDAYKAAYREWLDSDKGTRITTNGSSCIASPPEIIKTELYYIIVQSNGEVLLAVDEESLTSKRFCKSIISAFGLEITNKNIFTYEGGPLPEPTNYRNSF